MPFCILTDSVIHRIDAHQPDESSQKKNQTTFLNSSRENYVFVFTFLTDGQNVNQINAHREGDSAQKK